MEIKSIDDALIKRLAELPEVIADVKRSMGASDAAALARMTETEKKIAEVLATARAAEAKADDIRSKINDASFRLPGAEELVKRGQLRMGHVLAAAAVREYEGEARARELFPVVFDVDKETRKLLTEAGKERAASMSGGTRTQVTHDDALGGFMVPEEVSNTIVGYPYAQSCLAKLDIVPVQARGKPFRVPKLTGSGTVYMTSETPGNSSAAKTSISFGRGNMSPKKCIALAAISRELDDLANPSVLKYLEDDLRLRVGLKMEQQAFEGSGGEYEVRGLDKYTNALDGINELSVVGTDNGAVTAAANGRDLRDYWMKRIRNIAEAAEALVGGARMQFLMPTLLKQVLSLQQNAHVAAQKPDAGAAPTFGVGIINDAMLETLYGTIAHSNQFRVNRTIGGSSDGGLVAGGSFRNCFMPSWGGLMVAKADQGVLSNAAGAVTLNAFQEEAYLLRVTTSFDFQAVRPSDLVLATGFRKVYSNT